MGSWAWKSLCGVKVLKQNYIWSISDGQREDLWNDRWVPNFGDLSDFKVDGLNKVCDLIDWQTRSWRTNIVEVCFLP